MRVNEDHFKLTCSQDPHRCEQKKNVATNTCKSDIETIMQQCCLEDNFWAIFGPKSFQNGIEKCTPCRLPGSFSRYQDVDQEVIRPRPPLFFSPPLLGRYQEVTSWYQEVTSWYRAGSWPASWLASWPASWLAS